MRFNTLNEWLAWQESLHPRAIDLGLNRVREVAARMELSRPAPVCIVVAGTNGKGSCVSLLERILTDAGYRIGAYTSPHILRYNERVGMNGREVPDDALCEAFALVDANRGDITLSYFEFGTLAAFSLFERAELDAAVLEIGMGGRLDAVNIVDADVALITPIALDHLDWLGNDRETIGREKAGVLRAGRPVVCADRDLPASLEEAAAELGAGLHVLGRDFDWTETARGWMWNGPGKQLSDLPQPGLPGRIQKDNAAAVIMTLECLQEALPVETAVLKSALARVRLPGRQQQIMRAGVPVVLDVAHNPAAAAVLFGELGPVESGRQFTVFASMVDKDVEGIAREVAPWVDVWAVSEFEDPRAMAPEAAGDAIRRAIPDAVVSEYPTIGGALDAVLAQAGENDRIVVFGSFRTVAEVMKQDI